MKLKEIITQKKVPCGKCLYKLGLVETLANPCPECRMNGYRSYEWFRKQLSGERSDPSKGTGRMNRKRGRYR